MKADKRGKLSEKTLEIYIVGIILTVVLIQIVANLFPSLTSAGDSLQSSGFPLAELFTSTGAVWYILGAGLIVLLVRQFMVKSK